MKEIIPKKIKPISLSVDAEANAAYVTISSNKIAKTRRVNKTTSLDFDSKGRLVGIEMLRIKNTNKTIAKVMRDMGKNIPFMTMQTLEKLFNIKRPLA